MFLFSPLPRSFLSFLVFNVSNISFGPGNFIQILIVIQVFFLVLKFFFPGFMTKCLNRGGSSLWEVVLMEEDTITTPTLSFEDVTGLFLSTYTFQVVRRLLRLYYMDCCSCRRRSIDARTSSCGGQSESNVSWHLSCVIMLNKQYTVLCLSEQLLRETMCWFMPKSHPQMFFSSVTFCAAFVRLSALGPVEV